MQIVFFILLTLISTQIARAETTEPITLIWDWDPGDSGYTSGPNGDVAYKIYMRSESDTDYTYDTPWMGGVDNCWWNHDQYSCQTRLDHEFEPGISYYFMIIAYLVNNPIQKSPPSNEADYYVNSTGGDRDYKSVPESASGGGGCFIANGTEQIPSLH